MHRLPISAIILTFNEEKNIEDCLKSICDWAVEVFIVDSSSTDRTLEIARRYTDKIYQHPFETQAKQLNWTLENLPITTDWIMRLDADEKITPELKRELFEKILDLNAEITGLYVKRKVYFMKRWIRHGGYYPTWLLRIWRKDTGYYEKRWMDEHIKLKEGKALFLKNDIIDDNKKNLQWWINKHNVYATREAIDILNLKYKFLYYDSLNIDLFKTQEFRKRWVKEKVYAKMPLFIRPFLYFIYRYIMKFGFLDGKEGLIWHFLQGFWYRFLVDAKIYEIEKRARIERKTIAETIENLYNIQIKEDNV